MFVLKFSGLQYIFSATDWQVVLLLNLPSINIGLYLPFFFFIDISCIYCLPFNVVYAFYVIIPVISFDTVNKEQLF